MGCVKIAYQALKQFCLDVFRKIGFDRIESEIITEVLLMSDVYGIESHGIQRMVRYYKGIQMGTILIDEKPEVVFETPISAVIDGHNGMGQLIGEMAMNMAIEKAKKTGIGIVTVRNSNHYGIAGYYAKKACDQGLFGMSCTNSIALMVPTYGRKAMPGSNPIAVAMPADPYPFFFDCSTTVVTRGKLEIYNKLQEPLKQGWALDENGHECTEASRVLTNITGHIGGGIMPLGGMSESHGSHKGYGYAMLCELFSSIFSLGLTSEKTYVNEFPGVCHGFFVLDLNVFGSADAIKEHLSNYLQKLRESPKAVGQDRIYTHGEKEILAEEDRKKNGIPVNDNTMKEMMDMCIGLNMDFAS